MNQDEYGEQLDNIYKNLPEKLTKGERFEPPKLEFFTEGNKTIIKNFLVICDKLRRTNEMVSKYFSKELAVPVTIEGDRLILQRKLMYDTLNRKLEEYITRYVVCKECKRPDTNVVELGHGLRKLVCEACGASTPIN